MAHPELNSRSYQETTVTKKRSEQVFKSAAGRAAIISTYDMILQSWPVPYTSMMLPTRHGSTHVIACGDPEAPALFLLHGSGSNASMWLGEIARYADHYRVYAVDLPGEPGKSEPTRSPLQGPAYAEWMEDLYIALELPAKANMVGISLGGWMALRFATICPERVEKLVLLCPSGVASPRISLLFRWTPLLLLGTRGTDLMIRGLNPNTAMPEEALAYIRLIRENFNPRIQLPLFTDAELQQLTMPVLTIAGTRDIMLPSAHTLARLKRLLPDLTPILLPGAGHILIDQADTVLKFLVH